MCAFDPNTSADISGNKDSLMGHYKTGGSKELKKAVDSLCGFTADKYAVSTANQFKNAINVLSGAQISVPERISYKTKELSLSLMPGNQTVKGETLLKYFRYCLTPSGGGAQKQGELLCVLFSQYINKTYLASGRNYFSQIIDSLDTDISIVDFSRCERTLSAMAAGDIKYTSVSSAGELTVTPGKRGK